MKAQLVPATLLSYPAEMQDLDWNDLRFVLALQRNGTMAAAGRATGVAETTVARRIRSLEAKMGGPMFHRTPDGRCAPSDVGQIVMNYAVRMEADAGALADAVGRLRQHVSGTVRLTAVPIIANRVLVPVLKVLRAQHPNLCIELIPEARNLNLTLREADLAIRLARPSSGGMDVIARRIGSLSYGLYVPAGTADQNELDWIIYEDSHAHLPQARWLSQAARAGRGTPAFLRVADAETALEAIAAGLGRTVLPRCAAAHDERLAEVVPTLRQQLPEREIWLLSHARQRGLRGVQAVGEWVAGISY